MKQIQRVLYGRKEGEPSYMEEILLEDCGSDADIEQVKEQKRKEGYIHFRLAKINMTTPPDFIGALKI